MSTLDEMMQTIVDELIAGIDLDAGTWTPSWTAVSTMPTNASTGNQYRGMNTVLLWARQMSSTYKTTNWATYKQWTALGGQVRKGERGTRLIKWTDVGPDDEHKKLIPRVFTVFNSAQQDGWTHDEELVDLPTALAAFTTAMSAVPYTHMIGPPCFIPSLNIVQWPPLDSFRSQEECAGTIAHELAHWTGHPSRLNRDMTGRFGDEAYAGEELVAEISAAFTCATFGVASPQLRTDHVQYLSHWLAVLKADPSRLMAAAQQAQRATSHLLSYSEVKNATHEQPLADPAVERPTADV